MPKLNKKHRQYFLEAYSSNPEQQLLGLTKVSIKHQPYIVEVIKRYQSNPNQKDLDALLFFNQFQMQELNTLFGNEDDELRKHKNKMRKRKSRNKKYGPKETVSMDYVNELGSDPSEFIIALIDLKRGA